MDDIYEELLICVSNLRRQCDVRKCFGQRWNVAEHRGMEWQNHQGSSQADSMLKIATQNRQVQMADRAWRICSSIKHEATSKYSEQRFAAKER